MAKTFITGAAQAVANSAKKVAEIMEGRPLEKPAPKQKHFAQRSFAAKPEAARQK